MTRQLPLIEVASTQTSPHVLLLVSDASILDGVVHLGSSLLILSAVHDLLNKRLVKADVLNAHLHTALIKVH